MKVLILILLALATLVGCGKTSSDPKLAWNLKACTNGQCVVVDHFDSEVSCGSALLDLENFDRNHNIALPGTIDCELGVQK